MRGHRFALIAVATLAAAPRPLLAQPQGGGTDMGGDPQAPVPPPATSADGQQPAPGASGAETPPADAAPVKDPKVAKKWLDAATLLVKKGDQLAKQGNAVEAKTNYANAVTAYEKAIEASDDVTFVATTNLALSIAREKAGDLVGALKAAKVVVATQGLKVDLAKKAQTRLDEVSMKVGVVTLTITPEGTQISLEGTPVGEAPMTEPLVLPPGTHVITLTAVGYQPRDVELKIEAGSESERKIDLEPVPIVTKPTELPPEPEKPAPVQKPNMLPLYIGGGATIGLALFATVSGIVAIGRHGQYVDATTEPERADLRSSGKAWALVTDLSLLGAVGAAAFTTYWYLHNYRPEAKALAERQARGPKLDVVPWVQSDAGGLTAVGSF